MTPFIDTIAAAIAGDTWAAMDERDRHGVRQAARRQIKRVARAIYEVWRKIEGAEATFEDLQRMAISPGYPNATRAYHTACTEAVAAILAMPEPVIDEALK